MFFILNFTLVEGGYSSDEDEEGDKMDDVMGTYVQLGNHFISTWLLCVCACVCVCACMCVYCRVCVCVQSLRVLSQSKMRRQNRR